MIAERLYWVTLDFLQKAAPGFTRAKAHKGFIHRVKRNIFAIDSTTLPLALNCIDWARHRRKKAAAKTHLRLDIGNRLPTFAVVEEASHHDSTRAQALCAGLKDGDVLLADRAHVDLAFLYDLSPRGVFFVSREKENMVFEVLQQRADLPARILADETVRMNRKGSQEKYPAPLRRITALVEVEGKEREMVFLATSSTGAHAPSRSYTAPAGSLKASSKNSSRPCNPRTSWGTTKTP